MLKQLGVRAEKAPHFGRGTKMIFAGQRLFRVRLAEQGEGADALHNVILRAMGRRFIMDWKCSEAGQGSDALNGSVGMGDLKIKANGEKSGQFRIGTENQQTFGGNKNELKRNPINHGPQKTAGPTFRAYLTTSPIGARTFPL